MWGTDQNFKDLRPFEDRYRENKISQREFLLQHPLIYFHSDPGLRDHPSALTPLLSVIGLTGPESTLV